MVGYDRENTHRVTRFAVQCWRCVRAKPVPSPSVAPRAISDRVVTDYGISAAA